FARLLDARELENDDALRRPAAFQRLGLAAAHDELSAVARDRGAGKGLVALVSLCVGDVDFDDDIAGHVYSAKCVDAIEGHPCAPPWYCKVSLARRGG